jgi:glycosyltransferase involved in cell wall biosynthesis
MKILAVHNSYQKPGGEDQVFAQETDLLRSRGHRVLLYQASNDQVTETQPLVMLGETIWNQQIYRELRSLMHAERPDIVHVHNAFPVISPAAYHAANEEKIPVVKPCTITACSVPRPRCSAMGMYVKTVWASESHGPVCAQLLPGQQVGDFGGSRHAGYAQLQDRPGANPFPRISPSRISRATSLFRGAYPREKIFVKPNYLQMDPGPGEGQGNYALFVGRLTPEKGISTLLEAWRHIGRDLPLQIAGDGSMASEVEQASSENSSVSWLKWLPRTEILQRMKDATVLILPSTWYEGFPMILAEAFAAGLPVIASNLGSMSSIVDHQRTGLHFDAGNANALIEAVRWFRAHPLETELMRGQARLEYETKYTADVNYAQLMGIYESVLSPHSKEHPVPALVSATQRVTA